MQIREGEKLLKQPFGGVREGKPAQSNDLKRRLSAMRRFVPWGGGANFVPAHLKTLPLDEDEADAAAEPEAEAAVAAEQLPEGVEPMYVWQPGALPTLEALRSCAASIPAGTNHQVVWRVWAWRRRAGEGQEGAAIRVDDMLTKFLRAHQREGLQFLFDCVTGQKGFEGRGWCAPAASVWLRA